VLNGTLISVESLWPVLLCCVMCTIQIRMLIIHTGNRRCFTWMSVSQWRKVKRSTECLTWSRTSAILYVLELIHSICWLFQFFTSWLSGGIMLLSVFSWLLFGRSISYSEHLE